ncbi:hypothetical protein SDC9_78537 [bioreactor metagenome]|uniref:Uncharacterized protein n=1 Tax=bioreactor metagenome TaxID=1076179 RepID=A0A644YTR7_9ZZZZ
MIRGTEDDATEDIFCAAAAHIELNAEYSASIILSKSSAAGFETEGLSFSAIAQAYFIISAAEGAIICS